MNCRHKNVKAISDADDAVPLTMEERRLLDKANGRVLLFYLSGPMIFGVARAVTRQHAVISKYEAVVIDLEDVPMLDVTVSLAIQNAIKDAIEAGRSVFLVTPANELKTQLTGLGIANQLPPSHLLHDRTTALQRAVSLVTGSEVPLIEDEPVIVDPARSGAAAGLGS